MTNGDCSIFCKIVMPTVKTLFNECHLPSTSAFVSNSYDLRPNFILRGICAKEKLPDYIHMLIVGQYSK